MAMDTSHLTARSPFSVIDQDQLSTIIQRHPNAIACSSHQIHLPPPSATQFRPIPVVFIRHPLLRIRSVFLFGKRGAEKVLETVTRSDPLAGLEDWITQKPLGKSFANLQPADEHAKSLL